MTTSNFRTPGRLLVVDDNKVNRILLLRGLEQLGHSAEQAENGKQALELLQSQPFDMVLLDIEMPEMNGFEVLEYCLNNPKLRNIPIVMTSASDELNSVVKCIEMGAEDFLTKPLNTVLLQARVNASLDKKRLRDQQRKLFDTFAISEVAEELLSEGFSLGGKQVEASVMFTDIRSYTTISESHDPAEIIGLLNTYFALMFEPVSSHHGIVCQIQGDGLLAVFGTPIPREDHAEQAVMAGQEMLELLEGFNKEQEMLGKPRIDIGIGIASGEFIAGYVGTQQRAIFSCIGDTVNLASRIEGYTKEAGHPIIVDEQTKQQLSESFNNRFLDSVVFKGKQKPVDVFAIESD